MKLTDKEILDKFNNGQRSFKDIDIDDGVLRDADLQGISFDGCFLLVGFSGANLKGARFTNCNLKTCDFSGTDLTNAHFENNSVDSADFAGAKVMRTVFKDGYYHSAKLQQTDFEEWTKREKKTSHNNT